MDNAGNWSSPLAVGPFIIGIPVPVGGIAELPEVAGAPLEAPGSSGPSASVLTIVAAAVAAAALALGGVTWYARRRWAN